MAARLRRELEMDVEMVHGSYGEFTVLVDEEIVLKGGDDLFDVEEPNFNRFNNTLTFNYGLGNDTFDTNAGNFFAFGTSSKNGPEVIV